MQMTELHFKCLLAIYHHIFWGLFWGLPIFWDRLYIHRYTPEIPEPTCTILILAWGWICGSSSFPRNQNTLGSSGAYGSACTAIWAWRQTSAKCPTVRKDSEHIWFAFIFVCADGKNPKTLKFSLMADNAITRGGKGGLESLVYICGYIL